MVDDVVIKGNSLIRILDILHKSGIEADVHIAACTDSFIAHNRSYLHNYLKGSYSTLSEINTYQLSQFITEYIEASMCPNNIDQPIYKIFFENNQELSKFLSENVLTNITSSNQELFGIRSYVIHFSTELCKGFMDSVNDFHLIDYVKIRILYKFGSKELIAIPFVLLSEITYDDLERNYKLISSPLLDNFIYNSNNRTHYENKLKCMHYTLAVQVISSFFSKYSGIMEYSRLDSNDNYIFANNILDLMSELQAYKYVDVGSYQQRTKSSLFRLNEHLGFAYDFIYSDKVDSTNYYDSENKKITSEIITLENIRTYMNNYMDKFDDLILSNIIDVLIDKGILVPSVIHSDHGTIIRAYKCGEIYRLTSAHFKLFAYMLGLYSKDVGRPIYKTELEKLCVLFFRKMENEQYMKPIEKKNKGRQDEYSICYSKFGPRVSTSKPIYSANEESVLASKLRNDGQITKVKHIDSSGIKREMYQIEFYGFNSPEDETWDVTATRFAIQYSKLHNGYLEIEEDIKSTYIHTYIEFLILLSIGMNKRDHLLSLLAELYLFNDLDIKSDMNIDIILSKTNRVVDALVSGMWKYMCYAREVHPLRDSYKKMLNLDSNMVLAFDLHSAFEKGEWVKSLIEECGNLIYQTMYVIYFLCKKYNVRCKYDMENKKKREFYFYKMRKLRKETEDLVLNSVQNKDADVLLLIDLQNRALQYIDRFDLEETPMPKRFKIAFSFAGEHRSLIDQIVEIIRISKFSKDELLYDRYHESEFSKPDLDLHLYNLYSQESELIVVFLSKEYNDKSWPNIEYRAIRRLLNEGSNNERIMFIRLDKSEIKGISHFTDGAVNIDNHTPPELAELILERYKKDIDIN